MRSRDKACAPRHAAARGCLDTPRGGNLKGPACGRRMPRGAVAQMGERCNRTAEVRGSIPLGSTTQSRENASCAHSRESGRLPAGLAALTRQFGSLARVLAAPVDRNRRPFSGSREDFPAAFERESRDRFSELRPQRPSAPRLLPVPSTCSRPPIVSPRRTDDALDCTRRRFTTPFRTLRTPGVGGPSAS